MYLCESGMGIWKLRHDTPYKRFLNTNVPKEEQTESCLSVQLCIKYSSLIQDYSEMFFTNEIMPRSVYTQFVFQIISQSTA